MNDIEKLLGDTSGRTSRKTWITRAAIASLALLLVLAAGYAFVQSRKPKPPQYVTDTLRRGDLSVSVTATGTLQPTNKVDIGSELSGTIERVLVDFNQQVKKGQVLASLDTTKLQNQVERTRASLQSARARADQVRADLAQAQSNLARFEKVAELSGGRLPAANELDDARIRVVNAKAAVAAADAAVAETAATLRTSETDFTKAVIRSPINGVVLNRNVEPGQTVAASLQAPILFTLAEDLAQMELKVAVAEADVGSVEQGQAATFNVDAYPDKKYQASVRQIRYSSTTVENVVSYETVLSVNNADLSLRPGMTATADILVAVKENVLLVSNAALRFKPPQQEQRNSNASPLTSLMPRPPANRQRGNRPERPPNATPEQSQQRGTPATLWTLDAAGQLRAVRVFTGLTDGRQTEIRSRELKAGDVIVTDIALATR